MNFKQISLLSLVLIGMVITDSIAQIDLPAPSPLASLSQKVGLTDVEISYSRPSKKGRTIFGDLVPYDKLWRTGANMATKVSFSDDVKIDGKELAAGTYALFTIPGKEEWTIIFNKNYNQGGTGSYKEDEDALRITAKAYNMDANVETFMIVLDEVKPDGATIGLLWEDTYVGIPLSVSIDERIMASIDRSMTISPNTYNQAALYYQQSGKDLNQALEWINKAIEMHEANDRNVFWIYRQKSLIEADLKKYNDAVKTAETSLAKAKEAGNDDYIKMNTESIAEWSKK